MQILLLEDDDSMAERITDALTTALDAEIKNVARGEEALDLASRPGFDVLVLDRMVVGLDGLSVLEELRRRDVQTPALILSSKSKATQKVEGLDGGADDYLGKPFQDFELVARVRALRRRADKLEHPDVRAHGPLLMAIRNRRALWQPGVPAGAEQYAKRFVADQKFDLQLTDKEFDILLCLVEAFPDAASKEDIWNFAWQSHKLADWRQVVNVNMSRLRRKLDDRTGRRLVQALAHALKVEKGSDQVPNIEAIAKYVLDGKIFRSEEADGSAASTASSKGPRILDFVDGADESALVVDPEDLKQAGSAAVPEDAVPPIVRTVESEGYAMTSPESLQLLATCAAVF